MPPFTPTTAITTKCVVSTAYLFLSLIPGVKTMDQGKKNQCDHLVTSDMLGPVLLELATYNLPSGFRPCCHVLLVTWSEPVILAQVGCDSFSYKLKKSSRKKPIWWAKKYITMAKLQMGTPNERWHQGTGRTYQDREHAGTGGLGAHGTLRRPELHLLFPFGHHRPHFSVKYDV